MPFFMSLGPAEMPMRKPAKTGRPKRNRGKNKSQRQARKRNR